MPANERHIIARLGLAPHPEGGWYRETWRAGEGRGAASAILFLLPAHARSHWHRIDADELWIFQGGGPVQLRLAAASGGDAVNHRLGPDILSGDQQQLLVPKGDWQSAEAGDSWALVSCIVSPGFDFAGFELAAPGGAPGGL